MNWTQLLFSFDGRIGRAPHWYFVLAATVVMGGLFVFAGVSMFADGLQDTAQGAPPVGAAGLALPIAGIALLWPSLAISAKRWHDVDKSAWWILIGLVPVVGGLIALIFNGLVAGTPAANRFGNPPRSVAP